MNKKFTAYIFSLLTASFVFAEEPVADFEIDLPTLKNESQIKTKVVSTSEKEKKASAQKNYIIPEPKRKDIGISGVFKEPTLKYREHYLTASNRQWLADILYASIPYRPYIRAKLKEKKMPLYLQYLPIVESNYKPTAVSGSGATGLWQFMANSMHPYLKKNEYFDERRDPWKETDAALLKLAENFKKFNDWHLAIAAYNMGAGAVGRIVKANPGKDYWALAEKGLLSKQASEYIPKLIAIADIVENADFYGAIEIGVADKRIEGVAPEKFSYLTIKGSIKLSTVAQAAEIPLETVKMLNIELLKEITPPESTYRLRLPAGKAKIAAENLR